VPDLAVPDCGSHSPCEIDHHVLDSDNAEFGHFGECLNVGLTERIGFVVLSVFFTFPLITYMFLSVPEWRRVIDFSLLVVAAALVSVGAGFGFVKFLEFPLRLSTRL
jgi:hypothetical protein